MSTTIKLPSNGRKVTRSWNHGAHVYVIHTDSGDPVELTRRDIIRLDALSKDDSRTGSAPAPSPTVTIEELRAVLTKALRILDDPHPGLIMWHMAVGHALDEIRAMLGADTTPPYGGPEEDT